MLRAFHLHNEGSPWQTQSNGVKRKHLLKNSNQNEKTFSFGLHFQYFGMSLKLTAPAKKKESSQIRKKKQEKCLRLLADLSAWQIGEVTVAVFGIF